MVTFCFSSYKKPKKREVKKDDIIYRDIIGEVVLVDNHLRVKYDDITYVIHPNTLKTKGKRIIYRIQPDENGRRIKIIRNQNEKFDVGTKHYCNVAPGIKVLGNIVTNEFDMHLFYIKRIINEEINGV